MELCDIRINKITNNIQVSSENLEFSWSVKADNAEREIRQNRCRIVVYDAEGGIAGDTGIQNENRLCGVRMTETSLVSDTRYRVIVTAWVSFTDGGKKEEKELESESWFETGLLDRKEWKGLFLTEENDGDHSVFYRNFIINEKPISAKIYILCAGQYECRIDGRVVTDSVLNPAWSDYRKTMYSNTWDVTKHLEKGANYISLLLGDGMYNIPGGRYVYYPRTFGKAGFVLQLRMTFADGHREWIITDRNWSRKAGPLTFSCIYGGEDIDLRWPQNQRDTDLTVRYAPLPEVVIRPQQILPIRVMRFYAPLRILPSDDGTWIADFGKNFSGRIRITIRTDGKMDGKRISLRPAELLDGAGRIRQDMTRNDYSWNLVLNSRNIQTYTPVFSYTGFRYVCVQGCRPEQTELRGEFLYPDVEEGSSFRCSREKWNQIYQLIRQAIDSNTKSYFTDCPTREKLPWLEQTHLVAYAIMHCLDVQNLYRKISRDMADSQRENGLVPDIAPEYIKGFERWNAGFLDSPEWGSACILAPWYAHCYYGDDQILRDSWPTMERYIQYLSGKAWHGLQNHGLGDWLDEGPCKPYSQNTPRSLVASAVYYQDLTVMEQIAAFMGKRQQQELYAKLAQETRENFRAIFMDPQTGRFGNGSQTAQAMSLVTGLVPPELEQKALHQLADEIRKRNFAVTAGDVGHAYVVAALLRYRCIDLIAGMLEQDSMPGYAWQIKMGATSLTEEWGGSDPNHPQGSQNHLMLGEGLIWLTEGIGGICFCSPEEHFGTIRISPMVPNELEWAEARQRHPYGMVTCRWDRCSGDRGRIFIKGEIPPGLSAVLCDQYGHEIRTVGSGSFQYEIQGEKTDDGMD